MVPALLILLSAAWTGFDPSGPFKARVEARSAEVPAASASLEGLITASVAALGAKDTAGLQRLAVGREEFLGAYPGFAVDTTAARREFAVGYFLTDNRKLLLRGLATEGGKGLALSRFQVEGPVEKYGNATLFRGLRVWVKQSSAGDAEVELRFLKSAAKTPSGWRIWSFSDD